MLVLFYRINKNIETKNRIKEEIIERLNQRFDWRLYYLSAVYDILGTDNEFFSKLIDIHIAAKPKASFFGHYSKDERIRDFRLGAIINLCFKYKIDLKGERFSHLKRYDPYYDWLMDMEDFDYSQFNPRWISEYPTTYYFNRMEKVKGIQEKVHEYLKKHNDPLLMKHYMTIMEQD
jgi:hypothetical protein